MENLEQYGSIPVDFSSLERHYNDLRFPKDKISALEKAGELIRLKKGKYLVSKNLGRNPPSLQLIANHLYGPSYVSFESALSLSGHIPERTYSIRSAITKRRKQFHTPYGLFEYLTVPEVYYSVGIRQHQTGDSYAYLVASPEKALCDLIIASKGLRIQSEKSMSRYLVDNLRIDPDDVASMDTGIIGQASASGYKKQELKLLLRVIENLNA
jgi:hypothetical protein